MNGIGIKSVKNFPKLPKLQIVRLYIILSFQLELSNNNLTGIDFEKLVSLYPKLYKIKLNNNNIKSMDELKKNKKLPLQKISIMGNPFIEKKENYKKDLFKMFPNLFAVDGKNIDDFDVESTQYLEEETESISKNIENQPEEFEEDDLNESNSHSDSHSDSYSKSSNSSYDKPHKKIKKNNF